jgi:hypothetical protein
MYLELADLLKLVEIAKKSTINRVVLPRAGVTLTVRESHGGHVYETLHLVSGMPLPEAGPENMSIKAPVNVSQWDMKK